MFLRGWGGLCLLFGVGLGIRLLLAATTEGLQFDVLLFREWSERLAQRGPGQFYAPGYFVDYPPGYLYVLLVLGKVSHALTGSAPPIVLLKLPAIAADLGVALLASALAVSIARQPSQRRTIGIVAASAILFNPALILLSAVWGQVDSMLALFVLSSIYLIAAGRPNLLREASGIVLLAIVLATKPQAIFALPIVAVVLIHRYTGGGQFLRRSRPVVPLRLGAWLALGYLVIALMFAPFGVSAREVPEFYRTAGSVYPFTSLWAFNAWGVLGFYRPDTGPGAEAVAGIPALYAGLLAFGIVTILLALLAWRSLARGAAPAAVAAFGVVAVTCAAFALLTRSHERYLYLAVAGLAPFVGVRSLRWALIALSGLYFLNIHFVYVYFSQHAVPPGGAWTIQPLYGALFGAARDAWQLKLLSAVTATACLGTALVGWRWLEPDLAEPVPQRHRIPRSWTLAARDSKVMLCLFALVSAFLLLFSQGAVTDGSDGSGLFAVTRSIVEDRSLAIGEADRKFYASHGVGLPLAATVPYALVRPLEPYTGLGPAGTEAVVASLIPLSTALLVVSLYWLARQLGADVRHAVLVAMGAVCGTYLLAFSKEFFSEPLATLFITLAISAVLAQRPAAAGAALAAAALMRPQIFALAPILVWRLWTDAGLRAALRGAVPISAGVLITLGFNVARFANPLNFGYEGLGFTTPLHHGIAGVIFHPDKSLFLFAPVVLLVPLGLHHLVRINRTAFWLITGNLVTTIVISTTWIDWYGGWVWGPRTLIPGIVPAIAPLAVWIGNHGLRRRAAGLLFLAGFLVSAPTLIVSQRAQLIDRPPPYGPSVVRETALIPETLRFTRERLAARDCNAGRYESYVNIWQVRLACRPGPRGAWLAGALSLLLVAIAAGAARSLALTVRDVTAPRDNGAAPWSSGCSDVAPRVRSAHAHGGPP